ncbi:MAG: META domain-containing protein [Desulfovibrionaceae bacterium]|nr:META domain-containing protein [Desulfovibrionaceae bacterium]
MKKHIVAAFYVALLALTAACGKNPGGDYVITQEDLLHHRFVLVSSDGKNFSAKERIPAIEFNEGLRVSGVVCNRFTGQGRLAGNVLAVDQLASTKMLCADPDLNELENLLTRMLSEGAELRIEGADLAVRQGGHELLYKISDWVR